LQLPRIYTPISKLIEDELVQVKPLGPPLGSWPVHITYEWDDTIWKLEQRKLKIDKIKNKLNGRN
jgi:hypothetical protein